MATSKPKNEPLSVTHPDLVKEWDFEKNAPLTPDDVSRGSGIKAWWKCAECGNEWKTSICNRTKGTGCRICGIKRRAQLRTKSQEQFVYEVKQKNPNVEIIGQYTGKAKSVRTRCLICGRTWDAYAASLLRGGGCAVCSFAKIGDERRKPQDYFVKEIQQITPNIEILEEYKGAHIGILTKCLVCENEWHPTPTSLRRGRGCPECGKRHTGEALRKSHEDFKSEVEQKNPSIEVIGQYKSLQEKVLTKCLLCNNKWEAWPDALRAGSGCPQCAEERRTSFPEQAVFFYLSQSYTSISRYVDDKYELDIYLPDLNVGVEYDGIRFHTTKTGIAKENRKNIFFSKKGIRLIRIKESEENKVVSDVIFFKNNATYSNLPWAIKEVFSLLNKEKDVPSIDLARDRGKIYKQYISIVKKNSLAEKYPEIAKEWHPEKNGATPDMFSFASNKAAFWVCPKGHEYEALISSRTRGHGCPYCAGRKVLKGFNDLLAKAPAIAQEWHPTMNGDLLPSDVTWKSSKKVWWLCEKGHSWPAIISNRVRLGRACPECAKKKYGHNHKRVICVETGKVYPSIASAKRATGIGHIASCVTGTHKTAGGYHWKYYEDSGK